MPNDKLILVELTINDPQASADVMLFAKQLNISGFKFNESYQPIKMTSEDNKITYIIQGWVQNQQTETLLRDNPAVIALWNDTEVEPFNKN